MTINELKRVLDHLKFEDDEEYSVVIRSINNPNVEIEAYDILINNADKQIIIEYD